MNVAMKSQKRLVKTGWLLAGLALLAGCNLAPKYSRPTVETPANFKENTADAGFWKVARPVDGVARGKWWEVFNDPQLNALEQQVTISNQDVAAAFANFLSARAMVKEARAQYFPTLTADPSATRSRSSQNLQTDGSSQSHYSTTYSLPLDASWQLDLWDRVRNTVRANAAEAQATAADLENTKLTAQAELASDYFQLRAQDSLKQLFDDTQKAYKESLDLTNVRFKTGIASDQDVGLL